MITLSSDFGTPYPAAMKGVLLQRTDARLVDVGHDFPRQDVRATAFWLREVLPYFPPAVHLVVVDPGVGTDRAALAVRAGDHALVGPDNGVLVPAARELAARQGTGDTDQATNGDANPATNGDANSATIEVFEVPVENPASATFHGRDVFAPAAAAVHETGVENVETLPGYERTDDFERLSFPNPDLATDPVRGEVLVVDGFGNAITNLPGDLLDDAFGGVARVNGEAAPVEHTYAAVAPGERLVTVGSHGNVELAVNRGRGDEAFGVDAGDRVELSV